MSEQFTNLYDWCEFPSPLEVYRVISEKMQFELSFTEDFRPLAMYIGLYHIR